MSPPSALKDFLRIPQNVLTISYELEITTRLERANCRYTLITIRTSILDRARSLVWIRRRVT